MQHRLERAVASDLNARRAAERLHIHVNTAHYRLGKIAERTGCDLHRFADLVEILIAARFVPTPHRRGTKAGLDRDRDQNSARRMHF